jgi:hypothetical protein
MAILSKLYTFAISGVEAMLTATTVAKVSDYIDLGYQDLGDGATDLYCHIVTAGGNAAAGASFLVELTDCATSGGTYTAALAKTVLLVNALVSGSDLMHSKLPAGLKRYVKIQVTGAASMTGGITFRGHIATS